MGAPTAPHGGSNPHGGPHNCGGPHAGLWGLTALITPDEPWGRQGLKKDTESVLRAKKVETSPKIPVHLMVRHCAITVERYIAKTAPTAAA